MASLGGVPLTKGGRQGRQRRIPLARSLARQRSLSKVHPSGGKGDDATNSDMMAGSDTSSGEESDVVEDPWILQARNYFIVSCVRGAPVHSSVTLCVWHSLAVFADLCGPKRRRFQPATMKCRSDGVGFQHVTLPTQTTSSHAQSMAE